MPRTNFTDKQRAEIFLLDRATCSYSGRSLWIADYGIDPSYQIDWADHLVPASRGGKSSVENGAAAAWLYNYLRGSDRQRLLLYHRGLPTPEHTVFNGVLQKDIADRLRKFRKLDISDWFLNRAMWHIWIGVVFEYDRRQGFKRSRDFHYYARASLNSLTKWRRLMDQSSIASLEQRSLYPTDPEPDQLVVLQVRQATSTSSLIELMKQLFPVYRAAANAMFSLSEAVTLNDIQTELRKIEEDRAMPARIRVRLVQYARALELVSR